MALTSQGNERYTLKTPYREGTTHIFLKPLDFIGRPGAESTRQPEADYNGVFAPNSALRPQATGLLGAARLRKA